MTNPLRNETTSDTLPSWDLGDLYQSPEDPNLRTDIAKAEALAAAFRKKYMGNVGTLTADDLAEAIKAYEELTDLSGKFSCYAQLLYAADMATPEHGIFYQNMMEKSSDISVTVLFFTLELNKIDDKHLSRHLEASESLRHYEPWIRDLRAFKPYQLADDMEELLHEKNITGAASWNRLFDETLAGLLFPFDKEQLGCAEIINLLSSPDAETRKKAGLSIGKVLAANGKTFSLITNVLAKDKEIEDKWRNFAEPISSRNLANFIEDDVVNNLIETVKNNYPKLSHRYYRIKAKWFGVKKLAYWDRNAPLPSADEEAISWDEAVKMVLASYRAFSPELADIGQQFFDNNWIDAVPRKGKESGAFAHPVVPSAHPYLLLNYLGKSRDVMTLAHELGHGIHQVLAGKQQGALMCDTPLTLAETASVFGEQLTFRSLLEKEKDERKRQIMIAGKVEDMLNTVVRQVAFCEFERVVHAERQNGELSQARICDIWMDVQEESLGDAFSFDISYKYYWTYISHFIHAPFYVYAYAFGDCLVNALYGQYLKQPKGFQEKYITMLKAGGSLRHTELLAPFGLNAKDPQFWQTGINVISDFIDQIE